jgi:hypothetical protein
MRIQMGKVRARVVDEESIEKIRRVLEATEREGLTIQAAFPALLQQGGGERQLIEEPAPRVPSPKKRREALARGRSFPSTINLTRGTKMVNSNNRPARGRKEGIDRVYRLRR